MLTCVTRSAVYCGPDPLYNCKHIKSVQLSRGQMEEGVSLSLSRIVLNQHGVLSRYHQVGVGVLVITLSEPRQLDGRRVHILHYEVGHCFGH